MSKIKILPSSAGVKGRENMIYTVMEGGVTPAAQLLVYVAVVFNYRSPPKSRMGDSGQNSSVPLPSL
jgi:hypothetical protein